MSERVPIRHVAERAGVSRPTISRVLHDKPKVSSTTRARVLKAIEVLHTTAYSLSEVM